MKLVGKERSVARKGQQKSRRFHPTKRGKRRHSSKGRTGRFTYFPDKTVTRSWRITAKADELLREAGETIVDPDRVDPETGDARSVGATDVLEALARKYVKKLTLEDIRATSKG